MELSKRTWAGLALAVIWSLLLMAMVLWVVYKQGGSKDVLAIIFFLVCFPVVTKSMEHLWLKASERRKAGHQPKVKLNK